jgi:hypothetical protein
METRNQASAQASKPYMQPGQGVGRDFQTGRKAQIRKIEMPRKPASLKGLLVVVRAKVARSGHSNVLAERLAWHNSGRVLLDGASHDFMLWALFVLRQRFIFG